MRRLYVTGNVLTIIGGVFTGIAVPFVFIGLGLAFAIGPEIAALGGVGLIFGGVGVPMLWAGIRRAKRQLHALRRGVATDGTIAEVHQDTSQSINGRHPWAVVYTYEVGGRRYEGTVRSWARGGTILTMYAVGSPVHVLYVREDPEQSALYPPIR